MLDAKNDKFGKHLQVLQMEARIKKLMVEDYKVKRRIDNAKR
jgi:hypothetical protein